MKLYKKIMKSFGGSALYLDKTILNHLGVIHGDEVVLELIEDKVIKLIKKANNRGGTDNISVAYLVREEEGDEK